MQISEVGLKACTGEDRKAEYEEERKRERMEGQRMESGRHGGRELAKHFLGTLHSAGRQNQCTFTCKFGHLILKCPHQKDMIILADERKTKAREGLRGLFQGHKVQVIERNGMRINSSAKVSGGGNGGTLASGCCYLMVRFVTPED